MRARDLWPVLAVGGLLVARPAVAEPAHIFRLPSEPVDVALVRFGVQAGVSVGGFPVPGCAGRTRAVVGVLTASAALQRMLPPGCRFERVDGKAYRILGAPRIQAPPAVAAAAPRPADLAEVVVTAEKRREPLRGSPFAVSALTGGEMERLGAENLAAVALQVPGVAETNLGPGRNKLFIRGISDGAFTGRTQSTVGLYLDDVPITYNAPDPDLRLADVERVEVLRGPQGTLYGSGSIGGIMRIVTARPDPTSFVGRVAAEASLNSHRDSGYVGEAVLNIPLAGGRAAIRGVGYREVLPGYLDNPGLGRKDVNSGRRAGLRVAGFTHAPGGWEATATFVRQSILTRDSQYVQGGGERERDARILEPHDNDFTELGLSLAHLGSTESVRISVAYIDHDLTTRYDATGAFDLAPSQVAAFDEEQRVELWVAEAIATSAGEGRLRWLIGAFGSYAREGSDGLLDATLSGGLLRPVFRRRDQVTEAALFGELTYDLTPQLTATLGGRLFASGSKARAAGFGLARDPLSEVRGERRDNGFAPKIRLSYAFAPDVVLYAQAQDGFRAGGFNVPAAADGMPGGPGVPTYRPDRLRNYELGGEAALFGRRLTVRAALFKAVWRDVQTDQFRPSGLPVTLNIGDGSNRGVEAEVLWRSGDHWQVRLSGLANDPELTRSSNLFPARVDIGLPGVAKESASLDVSYRWDLTPGLRAEATVQGAYIGRSFLTFDGGQASAMGGYSQGRASLSVRGRDWQAQAFAQNLFDQDGDTFAFGNPFSRGRSRQTTPLPPRAFGLAIRRGF
jgi:outer membrane receptor protein involved in Fe transport